MEQFLTLLTAAIGIGIAGTVITLLVGVTAMAIGGDFNRRYGNRMMRLRVLFQGVTIALVVVYLLVKLAA